MRNIILQLVKKISPCDQLEAEQINFTISWILSGVPIFRLDGAAYPNPHLITYFVLIDVDQKKILLTDHKKSQLWIPTGGHIENNEHPMHTVQREIQEELGLSANFLYNKPFFLTVTETGKMNIKHKDVSLWYLLKGDSRDSIEYYDKDEFSQVRWFNFEEALQLNGDPHMNRFLRKLEFFQKL